MKTIKIISALFLFMGIQQTLKAQLVWDDFSVGQIKPVTTKSAPKTTITQEHAQIPGGKRTVIYEVGNNPYSQYFQLKTQDEQLIVSTGYGVAASFKIGYGGMNRGAMNKDLSSYKAMKISFKGKSNFSRVYLNMWSNGPNRALWYGGGNTLDPFQGSIAPNGSNRGKVITIPFSELQNKNGKFSIKDVDAIQLSFLGYEATGVNYAVDKIWFE